MNHDVIKDINRLKIKGLTSNDLDHVAPEWKNINYLS
jgi:hypothetical protein